MTVYVTFGSRVAPPPHLVRTVAQGLVAGGWAVVWSLKDADASHLPSGELIRARVEAGFCSDEIETFTAAGGSTTRFLSLVFIPPEFQLYPKHRIWIG